MVLVAVLLSTLLVPAASTSHLASHHHSLSNGPGINATWAAMDGGSGGGATAEGGVRVTLRALYGRGADRQRLPWCHGMGRRRLRETPT